MRPGVVDHPPRPGANPVPRDRVFGHCGRLAGFVPMKKTRCYFRLVVSRQAYFPLICTGGNAREGGPPVAGVAAGALP